MELLYVWIEDYKNIHHQGFNFSPKYRFDFKPILSDDKKFIIGGNLTDTINKEKKENSLPSNFFGNDISNVTAIVGQNGAGKSNLLLFLTQPLSKKGLTIFIFRDDNSELRIIWDSDFKDFRFRIDLLSLYKIGMPFVYNKPILASENMLILKYSYLLDNKYVMNNDESADGLLLLTTNEMLKINAGSTFKSNNQYILEENFRQLKFASTYIDFIISIFDIQFEQIDLTIWNDSGEFFPQLFRFFTPPKPDKHSNVLIIIAVMMVENFIYRLNYDNRITNLKEFIKDISDRIPSLNNQTIEERISICIQSLINSHSFLFKELRFEKSLLKIYNAFQKLIDRKIILYDESLIEGNERSNRRISFKIPINKYRSDDDLKILIESILNFSDYIDCFSLSWHQISSGEESMLNLFSRFYSIQEKVKISKDKSIIILIDEGELGFHPEWQRKYLQYLIDFFPQIYINKQIQIILTTHSPFLASDLPKENIIFLEKGKEGQKLPDGTDANGKCIVVDGLNDKKQTFGANIHTLFSDSFFLDGGLIGEFAKGKIGKVIHYLNNSDNRTLKEDKENQSIIDMIGEPILKRQLQVMMDSKRLQRIDDHEIEIKKLQEKVKQLETDIAKKQDESKT